LERGDLRLQRKQPAPAREDFAAALLVFDKDHAQDEGVLDALVGIGESELAQHRVRQALPPLERALTLAPRAATLAGARARFVLARALTEGGGDAARAAALARTAAEQLARLGAHGQKEADEIHAWQREHAAR